MELFREAAKCLISFIGRNNLFADKRPTVNVAAGQTQDSRLLD